jgi:hypothetical protein
MAQGMVRGQDPLHSPYVSRKPWRGLRRATGATGTEGQETGDIQPAAASGYKDVQEGPSRAIMALVPGEHLTPLPMVLGRWS